jgi:hypothetical protein
VINRELPTAFPLGAGAGAQFGLKPVNIQMEKGRRFPCGLSEFWNA